MPLKIVWNQKDFSIKIIEGRSPSDMDTDNAAVEEAIMAVKELNAGSEKPGVAVLGIAEDVGSVQLYFANSVPVASRKSPEEIAQINMLMSAALAAVKALNAYRQETLASVWGIDTENGEVCFCFAGGRCQKLLRKLFSDKMRLEKSQENRRHLRGQALEKQAGVPELAAS